jgi:hypothetical protein
MAKLTKCPLLDVEIWFLRWEIFTNEPLAVEGAGQHFQNPNTPLIVLHQIVIGGQDARNSLLHRERGNKHIDVFEGCFVDVLSARCRASIELLDFWDRKSEQVINEDGVV